MSGLRGGIEMSTHHALTIDLPEEAFDFVRGKVASGEYADASDVVRDSLGLMQVKTEVSDEQLRTEILPALEELDANPASGLTVEQVRAHFSEKRKS
jgi:putative addiction module CopG family antidote